jgi:1,3-beta-glucanosyltransferase GAS5
MSKPRGKRMWWHMFVVAFFPCAAECANVQCPTVNADPIIHKGKHFFHSVTKEHFPVVGIAYYPRPNEGSLSVTNSVDFFVEEYRDLWEADIEHFKDLGVNTIRIYAVDPSKNHDAFMCALQEAGIYVMVDLLADCEDCAIGPNQAPSCYPPSLKERGQWIINEFSKYTNTLTFSAGNEVTLHATNRTIELNAPCQKKFLRDMRAYINACSATSGTSLTRKVPVGMANWDNQRDLQTLYFNCRTDPSDEMENAEWYGLNSYQHCDVTAVSVYQLYGWNQLRDDFASYNLAVPVIITEYGCRERFPTIGLFEAQRTWLDVDALYSQSFTDQFAGGVVFEFSAEKAIVDTSDQDNPWPYYGFMKLNYGVGYYGPVDCDHTTTLCTYNPYPEFDLLRAKLATVDTSFMPDFDTYIPLTDAIPTCPAGLAPLSNFIWPSDDEPDLPCPMAPTNPPTLQPSVSPSPSSQTPAPSPNGTPIAPTPKPSVRPSPTAANAVIQTNVPTTTFGNALSEIDAPAAFDRSPAPSRQPVAPTSSPSSLEGSLNQATASQSAGSVSAVPRMVLFVVTVGLSLHAVI